MSEYYIDPDSEGVKKPGETRRFKGVHVVEVDWVSGKCETTHHLACNCREEYFKELERKLAITTEAITKTGKK